MESIVSILSLVLAVGSFVYTKILNDRNSKEQDALRNKANRLEVDAMYEKVRVKRIEFEEVLNEYALVYTKTEENNEQIAEADQLRSTYLLLKSKTKYAMFYNEIEAFCSRLVDGTINSEEYIKNEVLPSLKKDAVRQAQFFGTLNEKARKLDLPPIPKPEPAAFRNYNIIINKYFGNETQWISELMRIRNENSYMY